MLELTFSNVKSAGPDGPKAELCKSSNKSNTCLDILTNCLQKEMNCENKPTKWKESRTVTIQKKGKPAAKA